MFIDELKQAIEEEYQLYHYLQSMYPLTKHPMWHAFIEHVYEDEKSHYEMFQQLYYMMTGEFVQNPKKELACDNFKEGVKRVLYLKLERVEMYKMMLLSIPISAAYNPLFIAVLDEMEHAIRFSTMMSLL